MKNIYKNTAVIILAGGKSHRAETTKGLRKIGDDYWIDLQVQFFKRLKIKNVFIGLGFDFQNYIDKSVCLKNISYFINPNPEHGSFSTLQMVLKNSIDTSYQQLILMHIDHAIPKPATIAKLINTQSYDIVKPTYNNQSGHPIVLSRDFCQQLLKCPCSCQLNTEIKKLNLERIKWIEVDDSSILENFNTQQQWLNYIESYNF